MADPVPAPTGPDLPPPARLPPRAARVRTLVAAGVGTLLTAALAISALAGDTPPPTAPGTEEAVVRVSADRVLGRFDNPARYQNQSGPTSTLGPRDLELVDALDVRLARVWLLPRGYYNAGSERYDFDFAAPDGARTYRYLDQVAGYAHELMANLGECAPELMTLDDPAECRRVLRDGLAAYKRRYPAIRYVELFNEPNKSWRVPDGHWEGLTAEAYYRWYRIGYSVVNEINRELRPAVPLRIGDRPRRVSTSSSCGGSSTGTRATATRRSGSTSSPTTSIGTPRTRRESAPRSRPCGGGWPSAGSTRTRRCSSPSSCPRLPRQPLVPM